MNECVLLFIEIKNMFIAFQLSFYLKVKNELKNAMDGFVIFYTIQTETQ